MVELTDTELVEHLLARVRRGRRRDDQSDVIERVLKVAARLDTEYNPEIVAWVTPV